MFASDIDQYEPPLIQLRIPRRFPQRSSLNDCCAKHSCRARSTNPSSRGCVRLFDPKTLDAFRDFANLILDFGYFFAPERPILSQRPGLISESVRRRSPAGRSQTL